MFTRRSAHPYGLVLVALALIAGCDSSTEPAVVGSVDLAPVDTVLAVGDERQLAATVTSSTGSVLSGHPVAWASSRPEIASVSMSGLVAGVSPGSATVTAESGGRSRAVTFAVRPGGCTEATAGTIAAGQSVSGTLGATDCLLFQDQLAAGWSLSLPSPAVLGFEVTSHQFWPGLIVTDLDLHVLAWGEPVAERTARTTTDLPAGEFIVWTTAYHDAPVGAYELSIRELSHCNAAAIEASIEPGDSLEGHLGEDDCVFLHGLPADGFRLVLDEPVDLQIDLASAEFDSFLMITDLEMEPLWWNDDWGGTLDSRIIRRLPAGVYVVWATSLGFSGQAYGAYSLSVQEVAIEPCPVVGDVVVGDSVAGSLNSASCALPDERYADVWELTVTDSVTLQIDLTSNQFDAYLVLEDEAGTPLAEDDDGGLGLNARIFHPVSPGSYRVVVTTYGHWEVGAYALVTQGWMGTAPAEALLASPDRRPLDPKPGGG